MAGGVNAAIATCLKCAGPADRTMDGLETDWYECRSCGATFGITFDESAGGNGPPTAPMYPPSPETLAAIEQARSANTPPSVSPPPRPPPTPPPTPTEPTGSESDAYDPYQRALGVGCAGCLTTFAGIGVLIWTSKSTLGWTMTGIAALVGLIGLSWAASYR